MHYSSHGCFYLTHSVCPTTKDICTVSQKTVLCNLVFYKLKKLKPIFINFDQGAPCMPYISCETISITVLIASSYSQHLYHGHQMSPSSPQNMPTTLSSYDSFGFH